MNLLLKCLSSEGRDHRDSPKSSDSPIPEPVQEATPLLLLSMFSIAARYSDENFPNLLDNKMWEAGYEYADGARSILG